MALGKKILSGIGKGAKAIGKGVDKAFLTSNNIADGGGLSSLVVPRKLNTLGVGVALVGGTALKIGDTGLQARGKARAGYISYSDGMARMTNSFTSGIVPAMKRESNGNYAVFADMAEEVVSSPGLLNKIDDYGATPGMISALYNMGGR